MASTRPGLYRVLVEDDTIEQEVVKRLVGNLDRCGAGRSDDEDSRSTRAIMPHKSETHANDWRTYIEGHRSSEHEQLASAREGCQIQRGV
jgi:hypothetical protein